MTLGNRELIREAGNNSGGVVEKTVGGVMEEGWVKFLMPMNFTSALLEVACGMGGDRLDGGLMDGCKVSGIGMSIGVVGCLY